MNDNIISINVEEKLQEKKLELIIKRVFDLFLSAIGLMILFPLFGVIATLIKLDSKGPIFFKQERVGKDGEIFKIFKFRTMRVDGEDNGRQITVGNDIRITKIGKSIRKCKIDEFPQLINVFKGEMSLVGPRPEVPRYVGLYDEEQVQVLLLKPGITDYASIKFRDESEILGRSIDPEKEYIEHIMPMKLSLNLKYIDRISCFEDVRIIFQTILCIIR